MSAPRSLARPLLRFSQAARHTGSRLSLSRPPIPRQTSHQRNSISSLIPSRSFRPQIRAFSSTPAASHGHVEAPKPGEELTNLATTTARLYITFIDKEGGKHKFAVAKGANLLDIAQANDLEMEGACGGSCACSTCHVIVLDEDYYDKMPEPDDDENDMLDLAFGLTETSRLGCQVHMTKELDGLKVRLPSMTRNLQVSDFK